MAINSFLKKQTQKHKKKSLTVEQALFHKSFVEFTTKFSHDFQELTTFRRRVER